MDRTLYKELITLTQEYLRQEYGQKALLFSDTETIDHFRQEWKNINKAQHTSKQTSPSVSKMNTGKTKATYSQPFNSSEQSKPKEISHLSPKKQAKEAIPPPPKPVTPPNVSKEELLDFVSSAGLKVKSKKEALILLTKEDPEEIELMEKVANAIQTKLGAEARVVKTLPKEKPYLLLSKNKPEDSTIPWICLLPYQEYQNSPQNKKALWNAIASFYKQ